MKVTIRNSIHINDLNTLVTLDKTNSLMRLTRAEKFCTLDILQKITKENHDKNFYPNSIRSFNYDVVQFFIYAQIFTKSN